MNRLRLARFSIRLAALALPLAALAAAPAAAEGVPSSARVDPWIEQRLAAAPAARVPVLVELAERADLTGIVGTKARKGAEVYRRLTETARRTQAPLLARLAALGVPHRSFWIANLIRLEADAPLLAELAARDDVARLAGDSPVRVPSSGQLRPESTEGTACPPEPPNPTGDLEWGVERVNANDVWALGYSGQGVLVSGQDTGYQWNHPALVAKYRGWNGAVADHNYHWHDAIHGDDPHTPVGNPCGFDIAAPCDDHSHGTHTMGTMVGLEGSYQIGVAPGAEWISCRNMEQGWGTPTTYIECFQWFLAPTDLGGQNPDPSRSPDVINNSWGCPPDEGCNSGNFATMNAVVESLRSAGIVVVVSAGNDGSGCSTVSTPAAIFDASTTVGNTTSSDTISGSSSRGPVTADGSNRMKPDISAPGSSVCSSVPTNDYAHFSGTSMAGPHVAAAVALIISAQPALRGDVDAIESLLTQNALPLTTTQGCGGDTDSQVPNNVYGWGRLDALAAVEAALALDLLTVDDFELGTLCRWDASEPPGPACP